MSTGRTVAVSASDPQSVALTSLINEFVQHSMEYLVFRTVHLIETGSYQYIEFMIKSLGSLDEQVLNSTLRKSLPLLPKLVDIINSCDRLYNRTPLYSASSKGATSIVKLLLQQGATINELNGVSFFLPSF